MIEIPEIDLNYIMEIPISLKYDTAKTYFWRRNARGWKNKRIVMSTTKPDKDYLIKSGKWFIYSEKV